MTEEKSSAPTEERRAPRSAEAGERTGRGERTDRGGDRGGRGGRRQGGFQRRRKFCKFCADTSLHIDHKDPRMLAQFITERHKILPSRVTGTCSKHQRAITTAVKRARVLALLAFTPLHHD